MDKICKYYKYQKYVSYDNGSTWQPLNEYQKGELMQFNSEDCGGGIGTLYKWVVVDGEYECNGYDKYQKTQKYVSYDNGVTYNPVSPAVYSIGVLIENNSADCGYIPTPTAGTKWIASYQNSYGNYTTKSKECDNTIIDSDEVPHNVNQTGIGIDSYTYLIKSVSIGECVKWIGYPDTNDGSFQNFDTLTSVTIPNSVRMISNFAFDGCHSLTGVTIPNSVVTIGYAAFNSCYSIQNVVIPNSVVNVAPPQGQNIDHYGVFGNCSALTSCTLSVNMTRIPENMFRGCKSLTSVGGSGSGASVEIPSNITKISKDAFFQCDGITSVTIPNTVSELGDSVFMNCDNLRNVSLPNSITDISYSTFNACSSLTNIIIPNSVTRIGSSAFYYCNLSSINIPSGVTLMGDEVFARNSGMTSVTVNAITPPTLGSKVFDYTNNCPIYVPCESVEAYKAASGWSSYASRIQAIPNS